MSRKVWEVQTFKYSLQNNTTIISVNDDVNVFTGFSAEEFMAGTVSFKNMIHPDDEDIANELFSLTPDDISSSTNIRIRNKNDKIQCLYIEYTKSSVENPADVILEISLYDPLSLKTDIDKDMLLHNFSAMMDTTNDYIYFKDRNHIFTGASQTLVSLTDPTEHGSDMIGLTDYDVFPEELANDYYRLEKQVFSGKVEADHLSDPKAK